MTPTIHWQNVSTYQTIPDQKQLESVLLTTLAYLKQHDRIINCRVVDEAEMQQFNRQYRQKDKPTNVLSFPFEHVAEHDAKELGDLLICAPIVAQQAIAEHKTLEAHWAHMLVHGCLHLLGHDHQNDEQAHLMETLEIDILKTLNFDNPYQLREPK